MTATGTPHPHQARAVARPGDAGALWLLGGRLCLDFVNTIDPRHGQQPQEFLTDYTDLVTWGAHAGAIREEDVPGLLDRARRDHVAAAAAFATAHRLRSSLYRLFSALAAGHRPDAAALAALNDALAVASTHARLAVDDAGQLSWTWDDGPALDRVWWPVTRSAADLLVDGDHDRLRECPGPDGCGWLFYDTSRNGRRRWCSMQGCGNRAKNQRHYQRTRRSP